MGGENGHPLPRRVDGASSRCRSQGRGACAAGALFRTSVFEKGGASFKEPGPVIFASGGFGTDFTQHWRCDHDGRVRLFSTCALCWTGFGLQANIVEEYVLLSAFFSHLCWFEANVGPEAVFGTIIHLFQFSLDLSETNSGPCVFEKGWRLFQGVWTLFLCQLRIWC